MPGSDLALEKLSQAVHELDSSAGRIQERLAKAATYLIQIQPQELSNDDMRRMLVGIKDDLTFDEPEGKEDRMAGTLRNTDDADANARLLAPAGASNPNGSKVGALALPLCRRARLA